MRIWHLSFALIHDHVILCNLCTLHLLYMLSLVWLQLLTVSDLLDLTQLLAVIICFEKGFEKGFDKGGNDLVRQHVAMH